MHAAAAAAGGPEAGWGGAAAAAPSGDDEEALAYYTRANELRTEKRVLIKLAETHLALSQRDERRHQVNTRDREQLARLHQHRRL